MLFTAQFTNSAIAAAANRGFKVGISGNGDAEFRQLGE